MSLFTFVFAGVAFESRPFSHRFVAAAALFLVTSISLAILATRGATASTGSVLEKVKPTQTQTTPKPATPAPVVPAQKAPASSPQK